MFWETSQEEHLFQPIAKGMLGPLAKNRKWKPLKEQNNSKTKLSNGGRVLKCGICHTKGHNRKRCIRRATNYVSFSVLILI